MLKEKVEEVVREVEEFSDVLGQDNQVRWMMLHRSLAHKVDYHLSLFYPLDVQATAAHLDSVFWMMIFNLPARNGGVTELLLLLSIIDKGRS